jgi:hypothetical protein
MEVKKLGRRAKGGERRKKCGDYAELLTTVRQVIQHLALTSLRDVCYYNPCLERI